MSLMDVIYSIKCFLSTWPIPEELPIYLASGTTATCTAAGFFGHGGALASAVYNGTLTAYFVLTIVNGWTQRRIHRRVEVWLHVVPLLIGWSTAIASLPLTLFNPIGWTCWIGPWPPGCSGDDDDACVRGANADIYRWAFFHAILWACFAYVSIAMLLIYLKIRRAEVVSRQYREPEDNLNIECTTASQQEKKQKNEYSRRLSRRFGVQACYYVAAFCVTWIFPMAQFVVTQRNGHLYFPLLALTVVFNPLQGFWNAMIYIRPRYLAYRKRSSSRKHRAWQAVVKAMSAADEEDIDDIPADDSSDRESQLGQINSVESAKQLNDGERAAGEAAVAADMAHHRYQTRMLPMK